MKVLFDTNVVLDVMLILRCPGKIRCATIT